MRVTRKLNERSIRALTPREKPYKAADGEGLYLLVSPSGGKLWRLKYRYSGKERLLCFGQWPLVSLEAARGRALEARSRLVAGEDPTAQLPHRKVGLLVSTFADDWAIRQNWALNTRKRENYLMQQWLPKIGDISVDALTPEDVRQAVLEIERAGHCENAHRALSQISRILRYAVSLGKTSRNVAADLADVLSPIQSTPYATLTRPDEIGELLYAIDGYRGDPSTMYALRLLPLVFTRPGELRNAFWDEFDLDGVSDLGPLWRIPGERMKMRRRNRGEHLVPLASQAVRLLRELKTITGGDSLVFPGLISGKPISDATINHALRRMGYGPDRIVGHGFRAMASTQLNELGHLPDIIELQLAHRDSSVRAIYNRAMRLPERRAMMQAWADYLERLKAAAVARLNIAPGIPQSLAAVSRGEEMSSI